MHLIELKWIEVNYLEMKLIEVNMIKAITTD